MSDPRFTDRPTGEGLARSAHEQAPWWARVARTVDVTFPAADVPRDVAHGLGLVPDGALVIMQVNGTVRAIDVHLWTAELAWFAASSPNTRARLLFLVLADRPALSGQSAESPLPVLPPVVPAGLPIDLTTDVIGDLPFSNLQQIAASRLLGRGSAAGAGDVQALTVGPGLSIVGTVVDAVAPVIPPSIDREWSVLTNGDLVAPELIFAGGDVVMVSVP